MEEEIRIVKLLFEQKIVNNIRSVILVMKHNPWRSQIVFIHGAGE